MATLRLRTNEGDEKQPILIWDSVWKPSEGMADWALAGPDEPQNRGGLRSRAELHTAIIICLFTDRRMPENHPLEKYMPDDDRRGWWGDSVDIREDLFEGAMGSLLWIFERTPLTEEIRMMVEALALEALEPLIRQGAAVRIDAKASIPATSGFAVGRLDLIIDLYGRDGSAVYSQRFEDIWAQAATSPPPEDFKPFPPL